MCEMKKKRQINMITDNVDKSYSLYTFISKITIKDFSISELFLFVIVVGIIINFRFRSFLRIYLKKICWVD